MAGSSITLCISFTTFFLVSISYTKYRKEIFNANASSGYILKNECQLSCFLATAFWNEVLRLMIAYGNYKTYTVLFQRPLQDVVSTLYFGQRTRRRQRNIDVVYQPGFTNVSTSVNRQRGESIN